MTDKSKIDDSSLEDVAGGTAVPIKKRVEPIIEEKGDAPNWTKVSNDRPTDGTADEIERKG